MYWRVKVDPNCEVRAVLTTKILTNFCFLSSGFCCYYFRHQNYVGAREKPFKFFTGGWLRWDQESVREKERWMKRQRIRGSLMCPAPMQSACLVHAKQRMWHLGDLP